MTPFRKSAKNVWIINTTLLTTSIVEQHWKSVFLRGQKRVANFDKSEFLFFTVLYTQQSSDVWNSYKKPKTLQPFEGLVYFSHCLDFDKSSLLEMKEKAKVCVCVLTAKITKSNRRCWLIISNKSKKPKKKLRHQCGNLLRFKTRFLPRRFGFNFLGVMSRHLEMFDLSPLSSQTCLSSGSGSMLCYCYKGLVLFMLD